VQYYFDLARENALKNSALRAMNTLPIYLCANSHDPVLFILQNQVTKNIITDWQYSGTNQLLFLFHGTRLTDLLEVAKTRPSTTLYTFTHVFHGNEYLLSATEDELDKDGLKQLFIEYGQHKTNWRTYHLALRPFTYQENQRYEVTSVQPQSFQQITHLATLTEIKTNEVIAKDTRPEKQALNLLNKYVHRTKQLKLTAPTYHLFPDELRKEERYSFRSAIKIRLDGYSCTGKIIDFSYSGLKVQLDQIPILTKRSIVKVDFLELQKLSSKFRLVGVEYRAITSSPGNIFHLQVASQDGFNQVRDFFTLLVKNNPAHFTEIPLKAPKQPVTSRLHEVAESALEHALFFVTTGSGKPKLTYSSIPPTATALKALFEIECEENNLHNFIALSNNDLLERILCQPLRHATPEGVNFEQTIYIKKVAKNDGKFSINSYIDEDFSSEESKREFILAQKRAGQLQILHYQLSTITTPDLSIIEAEVAMISRHAVHLGKRIQEVLLGVGAIIEVIDRTDHVLNEDYQ
jgi:hypothetical protein